MSLIDCGLEDVGDDVRRTSVAFQQLVHHLLELLLVVDLLDRLEGLNRESMKVTG